MFYDSGDSSGSLWNGASQPAEKAKTDKTAKVESESEDPQGVDWQDLEDKALAMFNKAARRVANNTGGYSVQNESTMAAAEMLKAIAAMRAQRQAEEREKTILPTKSIKSTGQNRIK